MALAFAAAYTRRTGRGFTWMAAAGYEAERPAAAAAGPAADRRGDAAGGVGYWMKSGEPG